MAIKAGPFLIKSLLQGAPPASVNLTRAAWQIVCLNDRETTWIVRPQDDKVTSLSVGSYPYTAIGDGYLVATIRQEEDQDWLIEYQKSQDAYTIASASDPSKVWTVDMDDDPDRPRVLLKPLESTKSVPPRFEPSQLWRLESLIDD